MSQEPQWKREGLKKKSRKTPKQAKRKRRILNHWRQKLKAHLICS